MKPELMAKRNMANLKMSLHQNIAAAIALSIAGVAPPVSAAPQNANVAPTNPICQALSSPGGMPANYTDYTNGFCPDRTDPAALVAQLRAYALNPVPGDPKGRTAYRRDQDDAGAYAITQLEAAIQKSANARPAMVLDIDETSLSNLDEMLNDDFAYNANAPCAAVSTAPTSPTNPKTICGTLAWDSKAKTPAIRATKALFDEAQKLHVAVFFVTGRHDFERGWTAANLKNAGYVGYAGLYMEPNDQSFISAADFKIGARKAIQNLGYHIILNVGDQMSDLTGGFSDAVVQYPNPFYRLP
jgi:hypothetical protein